MGDGPGDDASTTLRGLDVAVTGRLASMSREEATHAIERAGGRYVERPDETTALLVVGLGGPPLDADGHPTRKLLLARELAEGGAPLRIVREDAWLELLADDRRREELHRLYTIEQLGRILGVDRARVRAWVRQGLVRPAKVVRRLCFFDYQEVVHARAVAELLARGVGPQRLEKSVKRLAAWRGEDGHPLVSWAVDVDAGVVTSELPDGRVVEPSGQLRLRFEQEDEVDDGPGLASVALEGAARGVTARPSAASASHGAELLSPTFARGVRAEEEGRPHDAIEAYRACEEEGAGFPEAPFNLGNVLYALERFEEAVHSFQRAVALDVEYVEAWNNLGNAWAGLGQHADAERAFRRALALVPDYADAHYNLAETLLLREAYEGARRHWRAYLAQDPSSAWAVEVREKLRLLDGALNRS